MQPPRPLFPSPCDHCGAAPALSGVAGWMAGARLVKRTWAWKEPDRLRVAVCAGCRELMRDAGAWDWLDWRAAWLGSSSLGWRRPRRRRR